jgi:SAM-dependent methyltransferase
VAGIRAFYRLGLSEVIPMGDSNPTSSSASSPEGILARGEGAHLPGGAAPGAPASTTRLYDRAYAGFELDARQQVRLETYGEDLGQNSWLTADEWREIIGWTALGPGSRALDLGCGAGGPALHLAATTGAQVLGIDSNADAIASANAMAGRKGLRSLATFQQADAALALPVADASIDAIVCIDAINHLPGRLDALREWRRVLRPGGLAVFTDPVVVNGLITNEEIAARTSIGFFVLSLRQEDERLLDLAGFELMRCEDTTDNVAEVARRWRDARAVRREELVGDEGEETFEGVQRFLTVTCTLASERRLARYTFLARRR